MFLNYEYVAVFSVSAAVTFFVAVTLLLLIVAKRGLLRVGSRRKAAPFLLPTDEPPKILVPVELMPLKTEKLPI